MIVAIGAKYGENFTVSQLAMQSFKENKNLKSDSGWSHKIYQCSVLSFSTWKKKLNIINTSRYVKKETKIISLLYPIIVFIFFNPLFHTAFTFVRVITFYLSYSS